MNCCIKKIKIIFSSLRGRRLSSPRRSGRRILATAFLAFSLCSAPFLSAQENAAPAAGGPKPEAPAAMPQPGQCAAAVSVMSDTAGPGRGFNSPHALVKEPPLTQTDIDAIIKIANSDDDKPAENFGVSPWRLELALIKVSFGMLILAGADPQLVYGENADEALALNRDELDLIAANLDRIAGIDLKQ